MCRVFSDRPRCLNRPNYGCVYDDKKMVIFGDFSSAVADGSDDGFRALDCSDEPNPDDEIAGAPRVGQCRLAYGLQR